MTEALSIQRNGNMVTAAATSKNSHAQTLLMGYRRLIEPFSLVVHPTLGAHLNDGDHKKDDEEDRGQRRRVSRVEVPEALDVEQVRQDLSGAQWTAIGQDLHGVEALQRPQGQDHDDEDRGRREQRQRYVPQLVPGGSAVKRRGLVQVLRDGR